MQLSVVTTLYKSSAHIREFHARMTAAAQAVTQDYEIIFVNDGSPDDSLAVVLALHAEDGAHVKIVDLSRNFGHHRAMMTGLAHATGAQIFLIDVDLEEQPEWLIPFVQKQKEAQCDVVYGVQEKRKGGRFEQWAGSVFYRIFNLLSDAPIPVNLVTTRLMSRRYVDALLLHKEREIFIPGLWAMTGFDQQPFTVQKLSRSATTYSLCRKIAMFVNAITAFTNTPLIAIFYIGLVISLLAGSATLYLVWRWLVYGQIVQGWTSVIVSIWLIGGLMISFIGVIGIYLSKIFSETKQRPYSIVRQVYDGKQ